MPGLSLTLRPNERFLVGGMLLQNGPRRASITVRDDDVLVLRLSDAIHPDEADSPVRRAYVAAQRILAVDVDREEGLRVLSQRLDQLAAAFEGTPLAVTVARAAAAAAAGRFHGTLVALRSLFAVEDAMLSSNGKLVTATR